MRFNCLGLIIGCLLICVGGVKAAPKPESRSLATAKAERLEVYPAEITLDSHRAYRQFVVTAYVNGTARDVTSSATYHSTNARVVKLNGSRVVAAGNGSAALTVIYGGRSQSIPVIVSNYTRPDPVQFKFETVALLTKQGCATGSCHGSPHGKGGFSLSLFGYDPTIDRISLTHDGFNRRLNVMEPTESLILKKPLLQIPHVGGKRLRTSDAAYHLLRDWIYEGADVTLPAVECQRIVVTPNTARVLHAPNLKQQLSVVATFSDGTVRDVTAIATYDTSSATIATVDADGLITGHGRGQAAISVRYLDKLQSVYTTVVEDVKDFAWNNPPENNLVDRLVDAKLKQLQYLPSPTCSDAVFLRRVSLDLTGMLPTADQTRLFLKDTAPEKRAKLVDALLEREEYARFWALKQADLMRVSPKKLTEGRADLFAEWIVETVRQNMPYDKFARAVLTATGDTTHVAPANYFLAIPTMEERTEMTAELFMGSRIECAKCHNHPFENWTMRDYYRIGAVFARTETTNGDVEVVGTGETQHPTTGEVMLPWGAPGAPGSATTDRRVAFADWLTRPGNPLFARVAVNRLWANVMGRGIVDPVDDFRSSNPPANVPLLDALAQEFERNGYDRKRLLRLICNSRTYQRAGETNKFNAGDETLFSHASARLLTAEQLKDAIGLATRVEEPTSTMQVRLADMRKRVEMRTAALEAQYPGWLKEKTRQVGSLAFWQGGWYMAGPFKVSDMNRGMQTAFIPETQSFDTNATLPGSLRWELQPMFRDGTANRLGKGRNLATYMTRRIYATSARVLSIQVEGGDAIVVWLNGQRVAEQTAKSKKPIALNLQKGDNRLLLKVVNARSRADFTYAATVPESFQETALAKKLALPPYAVELVTIAPEQRTDAQKRLLHDLFFREDGDVHGLEQQIDRMARRMDYATQRPYPESSEFTVTFGQPQRETACTCERQHSPTLLQALELLNGGTAFQMAQAGAAHYAPLENERLIEELYLSSLCRFPTDKERNVALQYLTRASNRNQAVMDLIWAVINTQEFLFQH